LPRKNNSHCLSPPLNLCHRCLLLSVAHPHLTAIVWDFPAKNPQISLRETSDNADVISNILLINLFKRSKFLNIY